MSFGTPSGIPWLKGSKTEHHNAAVCINAPHPTSYSPRPTGRGVRIVVSGSRDLCLPQQRMTCRSRHYL